MKKYVLLIVLVLFVIPAAFPRIQSEDLRLQNAFRRSAQNGWIFIHLQGPPHQIGFQHGFLLSSEIQASFAAIKLELTHENKKDWPFFRDAAKNILWPHMEREYQEELKGIVEGLNAKGTAMDIWDVVAMNAFLEMSSYVNSLKKRDEATSADKPTVMAEHCSAFVATGSYTKDGKVVMAHNNWTFYLDGQHWNIIFDIVPEKGYRILMDGLPGIIHSADDFGINSAGILITETTIADFSAGIQTEFPSSFVRAKLCSTQPR